MTIERALELLSHAEQAEEPLGVCPDTNKPVYLKVGRFGPYVQRGSSEDEEKPKNASLMKGMKPEDVTLEVALRLLSLPRDLGESPTTGEMVVAANGRFGPYVKCGAETRSLSAELSPMDVTLPQVLELLAQPKAQRRGFGVKREPLKVLEASPVTGQPIQLLEGRYGPYLTDGVTNASLPKQSDPQSITLADALGLLAARAAAGPPAKKKFRRASKAAPAAAAKKKTAKKAGSKAKEASSNETPAVAGKVSARAREARSRRKSPPPSERSARRRPAPARSDLRRGGGSGSLLFFHALLVAADRDGIGGGVTAAMRDADQHLADAEFFDHVAAPPRSETIGRPPNSLRISTSRQLIPRRQPVPMAFSTASLAAQRPAKCWVACLRLWQYWISCGV